jgi:ubiquinone/menaquinone biosynthesis C-methylase UbiE
MSDSAAGYRFGTGFGEDEIVRLEAMGSFNAPRTRMMFAEAGIRPGMRVLDLGCGAGDSTFVAADLVGPGGSVVGLDHSPEALARARLRAGQRGLAQVQFFEGDIHDRAPGGPFDAIVEVLALWQLPDPAEVLRRQATVLSPGGLVVVSDSDITTSRSVPDTPLWTQARSWALEAFARAGLAADFGQRLWAIVEEAGLRPLGMMGIEPYVWPGHEDGLVWLVESMRVLEQLFVGTGVATAEEIAVETFEQRLRDEWEKTRAAITPGIGFYVWATTGPA